MKTKYADLVERIAIMEKRHKQEDCCHDFDLISSMTRATPIYLGSLLTVSSICSKCGKNMQRSTTNEQMLKMHSGLNRFLKDGAVLEITPQKAETEKKNTKTKIKKED